MERAEETPPSGIDQIDSETPLTHFPLDNPELEDEDHWDKNFLKFNEHGH